MKIQRLKLVNFIGIKHGMDLDSVEIDFTKTNKKIIMLLGGNGAGKSVIMSMLHPFKESFDDRKDLILDGKVGEKEIDIYHNGHLYEIKHTYTKSAQSFIKKDGVELNENGGVRSFEDKVFEELKLTKDYFKIGKIGSNTRNFVDFTTVERKNYIGNFLNIEEILEKYSIVNNQLKSLKKDITSIGNELSKFQNKEVIESTISQMIKANDASEKELYELYNRNGAVSAKLESINNDTDGISLSELKAKIAEKQNDIAVNKNIKNEILEVYPDVESFSEETKKEISEAQTKIHVKVSNLTEKKLLLTEIKNKIDATKIELSALGDPEDIKKTEKEISEVSGRIKELTELIKESKFSPVVNKMLKNNKNINNYFEKTSVFLDFVEKYFTDLRAPLLIPNKMNIELFLEEDFEDSFSRMVNSGKKLIETKKEMLSKLQRDRGVKESYVCQLKNLEKRPEDCNIDSCPFIKDAYEHRNVLKEILTVDNEIVSIKKDLEGLELQQENLQSCQSLYKTFRNYYNELNIRDNDIISMFLNEHSMIDWIKGSVSDLKTYKEELLLGIRDVLNNFSEYNTNKKHLVNLENTKKMLEDSDSSLRLKYEKDIEENEEKKVKIESEIEALREEINNENSALEVKKNLLDLHEKYVLAVSKLNSASTMLSTATADFKKLSEREVQKAELTNELNDIKAKIAYYENSKNDKTKKLDDAKASLAQINILNEKLNNLKKKYEPISAISDALNPSSGIPLIFMKMYLEETEAITNELLNIAFNGDFRIKFLTTEKEFSIQVQSKGNVKPDIKMASQGEIAITTISISLALIEQSIGSYNILCLDEIDGHLDVSNRTNFMDILNSQINKLGIEQVFVISHNDAFDTAPVGMVLLKRNNINKENDSFMKNKDIVFDIEEERR